MCVVGTFQLKKKERTLPKKKGKERFKKNKQFKHEDLSFKKQLNYACNSFQIKLYSLPEWNPLSVFVSVTRADLTNKILNLNVSWIWFILVRYCRSSFVPSVEWRIDIMFIFYLMSSCCCCSNSHLSVQGVRVFICFVPMIILLFKPILILSHNRNLL